MTDPSKLRPTKLSHIGIQTYDIPKIRDWYCAVLNGYVIHDRPGFCVVGFDEEHHRLAITELPGPPRRRYGANPEIMHVAFTMENVFALLENYERLRDRGIVPPVNMNHGPTLSCYYYDPDGNMCELNVDSFPTQKDCRDWMAGPVFAHNHGAGVFFDPAELLAKMRAGASEEELLAYPVDQGMAVDMDAFHKVFAQRFVAETERFKAEILEEEAAHTG
jgi:catechol 2,3-dioxygenase-like lactoylglutathione lyase family enzyme